MKYRLWASRTAGGLAAVFLFIDAFGKVVKVPQVIKASSELGFAEPVLPALGAVLAACTLIYLVPRTEVFGAILLTGYLGGAVVSHVRVGASAFPVLFPVMMATLVWGGIWLRDAQLRSVVPLRN
ncbi:MAG: DoxX family protein [Bryobacteraceae bacterium]